MAYDEHHAPGREPHTARKRLNEATEATVEQGELGDDDERIQPVK